MKFIKNFQLFESTEYKQQEYRHLTKVEKYYLSNFIDFVSIVDELTENKNEENFYKLIDKTEAYKKFPFYKLLSKRVIEPLTKKIDEIKSINSIDLIEKEFLQQHKQIMSLLNNENYRQAIDLNVSLKRGELITKIKESSKGVAHYIDYYFKNPYIISFNFFNGVDKIINDFDRDDIQNLKKNKESILNSKTYLELPKDKINDIKYIYRFIKELSDEKEYKRINVKDLPVYLEYKYGNDKTFNNLLENITKYLKDNDKSLLNDIISNFNKFPELVKLNNKSKKKIKQVYRGIGFYNESFKEYEDDGELSKENLIEDIKAEEKKNKYVATSVNRRSALNFALMIGHLQSGRNSDVGVLIKYDVTHPKAIVIDLEIFGSIFNETEVLVNTEYAKIKKIEKV